MEGPVEAARVIDAFQDVISETDGFAKMGAGKPEPKKSSKRRCSTQQRTQAQTLIVLFVT